MSLLVPAKSFLIAAVVAWSGIATAIVAEMRDAPPVKAAFDARWDAPDEAPLLKKADRLQLAVAEPVAVAAVTVPVEQVARATPLDEEQAEAEKHRTLSKRAKVEHDVCTRHGMHKVWIEKRHWRSWRCRR